MPSVQSIFYNNPDYYPPIINSSILLDAEGFHHTILCRTYLTPQGIHYPANTTVHRLKAQFPNSLLEYLAFIWQTFSYLSKDVDIFIGHDMHGFVVARIVSLLKGRPVIYHCHDFAENGRKIGLGGSLVRLCERLLARTANRVIVPDYDRATVIAYQLNLTEFPIIVANAPLQTPQPDDILATTLQRQGYRFEKIVLRQGRISQGHAIEVTLRSMPYWASKQWIFVLIGFGEDNYIASLYKLADELGVREQFVILPAVNYEAVLRYTVGADIGHALYEPIHINHQYFTTASNKIMEYLAAGVPLLLSATAGSDKLLTQHPMGMTADVTSPKAISTAINTILQNPVLAQSMSVAGRRAFEAEFRYQKQYAPVLAAMRELIAGHHAHVK